jgi:signal transduction histidine kinase
MTLNRTDQQTNSGTTRMAWTTSDNLREFFGSQDHPAASTARTLAPQSGLVGRYVRRMAVLVLAIAHLLLLGELAVAPAVVSATTTIGLSLPWLTITGLMLAIVWLARDWPLQSDPQSISSAIDTTAASLKSGPASHQSPAPTYGYSSRPLSTQNRADPMTGLLARVSHDLRTPLNAVMGFSDLMQQEAFGPLGDARYQSYARHIHASSAELLKAAEDTLAMTSLVASPHHAATEIADLHELVSDAFTMALVAAQPSHASATSARYHARESGLTPLPTTLAPTILALSVTPGLQVKCERRALRQALINLISAALNKVVADGAQRTIHISATTDADIVCLTIRANLATQVVAANTALPTDGPAHDGSRPAQAGASSWNSAEDLPICLARALLELQGLSLCLTTTPSALGPHTWSAQVVLDGVSQSDFFAV